MSSISAITPSRQGYPDNDWESNVKSLSFDETRIHTFMSATKNAYMIVYNSELPTDVYKKIKSMNGNCHECATRLVKWLKYTDSCGVSFISFSENQPRRFAKLARYVNNLSSTQKKLTGTITIVRDSTFYEPKFVGGFDHYTVTTVSSLPTKNNNEADMYELAYHRYRPLFEQMYNKHSGWGLYNSLEICVKALEAVPYGSKLVPATKWLMENQCRNWTTMKPEYKVNFLTTVVMCSHVTPDSNDQVCIPFYHTLNGNVLELLSCANNKEALEKMIENRLSPHNYQRRTAPPKQGNIDNAMSELDDFTVTLMSKDDCLLYGGVKKGEKPTSSSSAFAAMKKKGASAFAGRATPISSSPSTIRELIECLKNGDDISIKSAGVVQLFNHTCRKSQYPFWWLFMSGFRSSISQVSHIVTIGDVGSPHCSVFFANKFSQSTEKQNPGKPFFPEFLTPDVRRTCGKAFEALKHTMIVKSKTNPFIGIGTSVKDSSGTLYSPLEVTVNGKHLTINKW